MQGAKRLAHSLELRGKELPKMPVSPYLHITFICLWGMLSLRSEVRHRVKAIQCFSPLSVAWIGSTLKKELMIWQLCLPALPFGRAAQVERIGYGRPILSTTKQIYIMTTRWTWQPLDEEKQEVAAQLSQELHIPLPVARILVHRGVTSVKDATNFFRPKLQALHDPFLMKDMDLAVARLNKAVGTKEPILVYGDYDVDGTTAVALVYKFLRIAGCSEAQLHYYIPDRGDDGYGVSHTGIDYAARRGVKLVIVLDCGIKALREIEYAKEQGIDFIVCDHHQPDEGLPPAVAVLDAKREENTYPFTELSGCGVGFKLMQAFAMTNNIRISKLYALLDLCAVSIASDLVSVLGENRILFYHGLKQLNRDPSPSLAGIIESCGLKPGSITAGDIVYKIGPLINASGRMMNGRRTVDLLLSSTIEEAKEICQEVERSNNQRRALDKEITKEAHEQIISQELHKKHKLIVVYGAEWHKGVIGIVASRLAEQYARPVIVLSGMGENVSGSARSANNFDMYHAIDLHKDLLINFGGHPYAAGLTLAKENLSDFVQRIVAYADGAIPPGKPETVIELDEELKLTQINHTLLRNINRLYPFGPDNPTPAFFTRGLMDTGESRAVGRKEEHLRPEVTDAMNRRYPFSSIAFGQAKSLGVVKSGKTFAMCYHLEENVHNGVANLQLRVTDIKPDEELPF